MELPDVICPECCSNNVEAIDSYCVHGEDYVEFECSNCKNTFSIEIVEELK